MITRTATNQATGRQISLSPATCATDPVYGCTNVTLLNQLDGFSVNSQIVVCFSGAINPGTVSGNITILPVTQPGGAIDINQIAYDPVGKCVYAKPDQVLQQQSQYLLVVNNSIHDTQGAAVIADPLFKTCLSGGSDYCNRLSDAVSSEHVKKNTLTGASLFTTMSTTDWLEKAHALVGASTQLQSMSLGPPVSMSQVSSLTWIPDNGIGPVLPPQSIPSSILANVDQVAFGVFLSPNFEDPQAFGTIAVTPTGQPISGPVPLPGIPTGYVPISYHVFLPRPQLMLPGGFPVAIYGHGLGDSQYGASTFIASTLAAAGIATISFEIPGHGYGPKSVLQIQPTNGLPTLIPAPGRGVQVDPSGYTQGCIAPGPIGVRDCARQTTVDLFALVKTIQNTNGLSLNLNASRPYFIGQSFGSIYGTLFHAIDPAIKAAVLNVGGGSSVAVSRLARPGRPLAQGYLATTMQLAPGQFPPLWNVVTMHAPSQPYFHDYFNDNYAYRDKPVLVNTVPGAMQVDTALEIAEWIDMNGDPLGFASKLANQTLPGLVGKSTLIQFAYGDLEVPNPTNSALIRTSGLQPWSWYYRFDKAAKQHPELLTVSFNPPLPALPHAFLTNPTIFDPANTAEKSVALAAQGQVALYLALGGVINPDPNLFLTGDFAGQQLFEIPNTLPEDLNFIQIQP